MDNMKYTRSIDIIFRGRNSLLDTTLKEILVSSELEGVVQIKLTFTNFRSESDFDKVQILFQDVEEFSFYHSKEYNFYCVESFKLLNYQGMIYISLDPDMSTEIPSSDDSDYILSKRAIILE